MSSSGYDAALLRQWVKACEGSNPSIRAIYFLFSKVFYFDLMKNLRILHVMLHRMNLFNLH